MAKERLFTDDTVTSIWDLRKAMSLCNEVWCRIPKDKLHDLLYHYPNDFVNMWSANERKAVVPKYHFYNISDMLNFIKWLQKESILYYTGMPAILKRQIESFMAMVERYIPNYKFYASKD